MQNEKPDTSGATGCLTRLLWSMGIPVLAIFNLILFVEKRPGFPDIYDLTYFLLLLAIIAVRYIDIVYFGGTASDGSTASKKDWKLLTSISAVVFIAAWSIVRLFVVLYAG